MRKRAIPDTRKLSYYGNVVYQEGFDPFYALGRVTTEHRQRLVLENPSGTKQTVIRQLYRSGRWCVAGQMPDPTNQVLQDMALERGGRLEITLVNSWFRFAFIDGLGNVQDVFDISDLDAGQAKARRGLEAGLYCYTDADIDGLAKGILKAMEGP